MTGTRDLVSSRPYYGETPTRDHLADAKRYAERIRPAVAAVSNRIMGIRYLFGDVVAEAVHGDFERLAETADECADSFARGVDLLVDDHRRAVEAEKVKTSEFTIDAARARCILRDALAYERTRRRRDNPEWMAEAHTLLAEHEAPF